MNREDLLLQYRADPTDLNFNRVATAYSPWIGRTGAEALRRLRRSPNSVDLDDLRVEGLLSLSRSARRFLHFCPVCGATFLQRTDLLRHAAEAHRVRGIEEVVGIETFCEVSARLAMRRAARRLIRPEEVLLDEPPEPIDAGAEERLILADLVRRAEERLSGEALALLIRLVVSGAPAAPASKRGRARRVPSLSLRMRKLMGPSDELKEELMENVTAALPEKGPRWKVLSLQSLKESAKEVLGLEIAERTVRGAYEEALSKLTGRELDYVCGRCNAPIDDKMNRCWACGAVISDGEEDPEMKLEEIQTRAKALGIPITASGTRKTKDVLLKEVEAAETRRRNVRSTDVHGIEAQKMNEVLTGKMPDGWTKTVSKQFTSYWDAEHVRRFIVLFRGLRVHFAVDDGFFPDPLPEGCEFLNVEERRKRHFGRDNYVYRGDVAKDVIEMAEKVFKKYARKIGKQKGK